MVIIHAGRYPRRSAIQPPSELARSAEVNKDAVHIPLAVIAATWDSAPKCLLLHLQITLPLDYGC